MLRVQFGIFFREMIQQLSRPLLFLFRPALIRLAASITDAIEVLFIFYM